MYPGSFSRSRGYYNISHSLILDGVDTVRDEYCLFQCSHVLVRRLLYSSIKFNFPVLLAFVIPHFYEGFDSMAERSAPNPPPSIRQ